MLGFSIKSFHVLRAGVWLGTGLVFLMTVSGVISLVPLFCPCLSGGVPGGWAAAVSPQAETGHQRRAEDLCRRLPLPAMLPAPSPHHPGWWHPGPTAPRPGLHLPPHPDTPSPHMLPAPRPWHRLFTAPGMPFPDLLHLEKSCSSPRPRDGGTGEN